MTSDQTNPLLDRVQSQRASFDSYTRIAAEALRVPFVKLVLVDKPHAWFLSHVGLGDAGLDDSEPHQLHGTIAQRVLGARKPVTCRDITRLRTESAVLRVGVHSFAGVAIETTHESLGCILVVMDQEVRSWSASELAILVDLGRSVETVFAHLANTLALETAQSHLRHMALRDAMTGLYNRRGFEVLASQYIKGARRQNRSFAILYADLDGLKAINDNLGHAAGDEAIRSAARRLSVTLRTSDIVARMGGDEFAALIVDCDQQTVDRLHQRLVQSEPSPGCHPEHATISVGFDWSGPKDDRGIGELLGAADRAMYKAKSRRQASTAKMTG